MVAAQNVAPERHADRPIRAHISAHMCSWPPTHRTPVLSGLAARNAERYMRVVELSAEPSQSRDGRRRGVDVTDVTANACCTTQTCGRQPAYVRRKEDVPPTLEERHEGQGNEVVVCGRICATAVLCSGAGPELADKDGAALLDTVRPKSHLDPFQKGTPASSPWRGVKR
jgi:hypothetical protein